MEQMLEPDREMHSAGFVLDMYKKEQERNNYHGLTPTSDESISASALIIAYLRWVVTSDDIPSFLLSWKWTVSC
jgi:hypothetical protein